jgi:hypothetical protein
MRIENINWKDVQLFYNNNKTWRDVKYNFNISDKLIAKARKLGLLITRNKSESSILSENMVLVIIV